MRIVPDDTQHHLRDRLISIYSTGKVPVYDAEDTIEITDNDWNEIYASYYLYVESNIQYDGTTIAHVHKTFATYLRELVELKRYNRVTTLGR